MSYQPDGDKINDLLRPRVVMLDIPDKSDALATDALTPQVIAKTQTGRVVQVASVEAQLVPAESGRLRRRSPIMKLGLIGLTVSLIGWLGVDSYLWIASAFERNVTIGWVTIAAATTGIAGAGLVI